MNQIRISSLTLEQLTAFVKEQGQPAFRAKQIFHWLHQRGVTRFAQMTDQPKSFLGLLEEKCLIESLSIERRQQSKDGTVKYLFQLPDGNCIETVWMKYSYGKFTPPWRTWDSAFLISF